VLHDVLPHATIPGSDGAPPSGPGEVTTVPVPLLAPLAAPLPPSPTGPVLLVPLAAPLPGLPLALPVLPGVPLLLPLPWPLVPPLAPELEPELIPPPSGDIGVPLSEPLQCVSATGPATPRSAIPTHPACKG
jgi:hypothetical protein